VRFLPSGRVFTVRNLGPGRGDPRFGHKSLLGDEDGTQKDYADLFLYIWELVGSEKAEQPKEEKS